MCPGIAAAFAGLAAGPHVLYLAAEGGDTTATAAFLRSLGDAVGIAVLGAVLARQVADHTARGSSVSVADGDVTKLDLGDAVKGAAAPPQSR